MFYRNLALFLMTSSLAHAAPELICFQDFMAETGSEVFDASRIFIRIKTCSCGTSTCTVGASGGGWNSGIELHGSSYCEVSSTPDGKLKVDTRDHELVLHIGESGPQDEYFKAFTRTAKGSLRYDDAGRPPRIVHHQFKCYLANPLIRSLPEWSAQ
jgi:hypothetical protein